MATKASRSIYQLKVTLNGIRPPIWRRILVPSDIRLGKLHRVLQSVMGWDNYHLHQFVAGGIMYGTHGDEFGMDLDVEDEDKCKLHDLLKTEKKTIRYEYDFGDSWEHTILLEKILPYEVDQKLPRCLKGKRACPPEDCGGVWGYQELLEKLESPDDPEHQEMIEWLGGEFDSEAFDIDEVNQTLSRYGE